VRCNYFVRKSWFFGISSSSEPLQVPIRIKTVDLRYEVPGAVVQATRFPEKNGLPVELALARAPSSDRSVDHNVVDPLRTVKP
jgi:hypothetical protein